MASISTHQKMLDEILFSANNCSEPAQYLKDMIKENHYLKGYLELAVSNKWSTIDVDKIETKQYSYHRSMAGALLLNKHTWNIIAGIIMNVEAKDATKIIQYKALSEMLHETESKILTAILTKNLVSIYPSLTHEVLVESLNLG